MTERKAIIPNGGKTERVQVANSNFNQQLTKLNQYLVEKARKKSKNGVSYPYYSLKKLRK